ncbi:MAG: hypothetical protein Q9227_002331 [Pyrenula ochraceoflavens]
MGLFSRKAEPATSTAYAESHPHRTSATSDPEKVVVENEENTAPSAAQYVNPDTERRVVSKMDKRIPVLVSAGYLLAFLDRSNIGNARIAGMTEDLDLKGGDYDWFLTIFYSELEIPAVLPVIKGPRTVPSDDQATVSYIIGQIQGLCWKVIPPHIWACLVIAAWGIIATCQAAVKTWSGEMALRFLMGLFEAGYGPGVPFLLSFFYLRHEVGLRCGIFLSAAPLANTFAGALAYGITSGHSKLANWRLLFLVEGIPTLLFAPVAFFFLPDTPDKAKFLTEEERVVAKARGVRQVGGTDRVGTLDFKDVGRTLLDLKAWITSVSPAPSFEHVMDKMN